MAKWVITTSWVCFLGGWANHPKEVVDFWRLCRCLPKYRVLTNTYVGIVSQRFCLYLWLHFRPYKEILWASWGNPRWIQRKSSCWSKQGLKKHTPGVSKECFLAALEYFKTSKKHPFETPGSYSFFEILWSSCGVAASWEPGLEVQLEDRDLRGLPRVEAPVAASLQLSCHASRWPMKWWTRWTCQRLIFFFVLWRRI